MPIRLLSSAEDLAAYDTWIKNHPQGNLWQSVEWKSYQESLGREVRIYAEIGDRGSEISMSALIVIDRTSFGLSTWDCPRGPLVMKNEERIMKNMTEKILEDAKKNGCMSLYFSPILDFSPFHSSFFTLHSNRHQQPDATRILDLTQSDDELLAQMHQKGRYNIGVARKNGVRIERSTDVDAYYELAQKTGKRDAFGIPTKRQLKAFVEQLPGSFLLLAYAPSTSSTSSKSSTASPVAGLIGVTWHGMGIYYYGASDYKHRALMAPYLLQWESMQLCKKAGCTKYDLLGIAPPSPEEQEGGMERGAGGVRHPWSGISDFKSKFGGTVISYPPEQEITLRPMAKRLLEMKRKLLG